MQKLEEILAIVDVNYRQTALVKYAKSLGVNPAEAKVLNTGRYNEEKLAILIFDAEKQYNKKQAQNINFIWAGALVTILTFAVLAAMPKTFVQVMEGEKAGIKEQEKILTGRDKKGKPVLDQSGEPVTFELMNGTYYEYYRNGNVKYKYLYENGDLIKTIKYDSRGNIIFEKDKTN